VKSEETWLVLLIGQIYVVVLLTISSRMPKKTIVWFRVGVILVHGTPMTTW